MSGLWLSLAAVDAALTTAVFRRAAAGVPRWPLLLLENAGCGTAWLPLAVMLCCLPLPQARLLGS